MATSHSDNWNELHCQQGSCKIILKPGDLLDEKDVNVLVIPTPAGGMNPDNFQLFKSIYSNADENCKREIKKVCFNLTQSEPQTFSLYGLRYIFVAPPYVGNRDKAPKYLKETYTSCLKLAVKSNFRTIAFPTIGCGVIGFPIDDAARSVYSAIENFCQSKDGKKMDEIRIVIYDKNIYNEFIGIFIETDQTKKIKFNFVTISTKTSNRSEMSSTRDKQHETQQPSNKNASQDYSDDFDDDDKHRRPGSGMARQTSNLNPNSPEFQPKTNNNKRVPRHFCLNNKRTELIIIQGDILKTRVDAIVNAANERMMGGSGVDGAIHEAAGNNLQRACKAHKEISRDVRLPTGHSRILLSYDLFNTTYYIINTAGPEYDDTKREKCKKDLTSCYKTSLALANLYDLETIGFTAISCGIYGYPIDEGAEVALTTVDRAAGTMDKIFFVLKDDDIYDAWIKKAEELRFTSLDESSALTQARPNNQKTIEKSITNNPSTSNTTKAALKESTGTKSSSKSLQDSNEKSESEEDTNKEKHDSSSKKSEQKNKESGEPTSNNFSKTKQGQNNKQEPPSPAASKNTNKSIGSTGSPQNQRK